MAYHFRNLVFEGGGIKGIAYIGALDVLADRGIISGIERIGGTSAGAINALLVGLGFTRKETQDILWSLDFKKFLDDSWGVVRDTKRLIKQFGWYKGDYFRDWIGNLVRDKTGNSECTFADLEAMKEKRGFKSLYFIGTNVSTSFSEVFSAEHTPRTRIADAVRISMSLPLFFAAQRSARGLVDDTHNLFTAGLGFRQGMFDASIEYMQLDREIIGTLDDENYMVAEFPFSPNSQWTLYADRGEASESDANTLRVGAHYQLMLFVTVSAEYSKDDFDRSGAQDVDRVDLRLTVSYN